ncbi:MAG: TssQ family T6SS-associated lipoprotein [Betaproteobacteria bacterium]
MTRAAIVATALLALAGCSSAPVRELQQLLWSSRGEAAFNAGMRQYENGQYVDSARNLQAAVDLGLPAKERARAHKHLAFIHCAAGRERSCRDEFRKALAIEPKMELTAAEVGHPAWGPTFRALKGGEPPLILGLRLYEEGKYEESAKTLQGAIERGLADKDRARAHKHLAFMHCASSRERLCREEFRRALDYDPGLQLTAAEAGHPAWGPVFRSLKGEPPALAKAQPAVAAKGEPALAAGLRLYEEGSYEASARSLHEALGQGLGERDRVRAHKHLAFIHCASDRQRSCREEFSKALAVDPTLELAPAEVGHPVWGPLFRAVKAGR